MTDLYKVASYRQAAASGGTWLLSINLLVVIAGQSRSHDLELTDTRANGITTSELEDMRPSSFFEEK